MKIARISLDASSPCYGASQSTTNVTSPPGAMYMPERTAESLDRPKGMPRAVFVCNEGKQGANDHGDVLIEGTERDLHAR